MTIKCSCSVKNTLPNMASHILLYMLFQVAFLNLGLAKLSDCGSLASCSECISSASCIWCSTPGIACCLSRNDATSCDEENLYQPVSNNKDQLINEDNLVSLEFIDLYLKVGESLNFTVSIKTTQNRDFPLDLYILMDLSGSFIDDLYFVKSLATKLPLALRNLSSDFLIGFGTFVDKPSLPYTSSPQKNVKFIFSGQPSSCNGPTLCTKPFNYEHVISLTNSSDLFNSSIQETIISINLDDPEDPLGAMMQAVVCKDLIGWREKSRKILLVMTDDVLHTAGDGRLAGIVKPNDGQCHTQYDPSYNKTINTAPIMQDYPSIEQVRQALHNNDIVPVFAIASDNTNLFNLYNKNVGPSLGGFTTILAADSNNLVNVLEEAYLKVVSNIRLSFNLPNYLLASITANCPSQSTHLPDTNDVPGVDNNSIVDCPLLMGNVIIIIM